MSFKVSNRSRGVALVQHKIGLYIRVSTEEQAQNPEGSIKNQEENLRAIVKVKNLD